MPRYAAFLRAINVGGRNVKMDELKTHFCELGFSNVKTVIASGNVIFETAEEDAEKLTKIIFEHLEKKLGFKTDVFLRTKIAIEKALNVDFMKEKATENLFIGCLENAPEDAIKEKLKNAQTEVDSFQIVGKEVFWACNKKFRESLFSGAKLEKLLSQPTTLRNLNTFTKIYDLL